MLLLELNFCTESSSVWQLVGRVLEVFKIVIPILIIIFGMIDLGKAVISSDEKAIGGATKKLMFRLIAALVVFFIPAIVSAVFGLLSFFNQNDVKEDYNVCQKCITSPRGDVCSDAVKVADGQI